MLLLLMMPYMIQCKSIAGAAASPNGRQVAYYVAYFSKLAERPLQVSVDTFLRSFLIVKKSLWTSPLI